MTEYAIGVDLGTESVRAAFMDGNNPVIVSDKDGYDRIPSIFAIPDTNRYLLGREAHRQMTTNPECTVYGIKRIIGRSISDPETQASIRTVSYKIIEGPHDDLRVDLGGMLCIPSWMMARLIGFQHKNAEQRVGRTIKKAVLSVPAYFNDAQRQATLDAGRIAGLNVIGLINEPTAAAIAYRQKHRKPCTLAVLDLGAGTFDVSILALKENDIRILSSNGDSFLGGMDFDNRIVEHLVVEFARTHQIDLRHDAVAMQRLRILAEKAKRDLSTQTEVKISLPFIQTAQDGSPIHLETMLNRSVFEELIVDLVRRVLKLCQQALKDASLDQLDIDDVLLVGNMMRMPLVRNAVEEFFKMPPSDDIDPDSAVAIGAAIYANDLLKKDRCYVVHELAPFNVGIAVYGGQCHTMIARNTDIPCTKRTVLTTAYDNQTTLKVVVLQGALKDADDNHVLAEFAFRGIKPAPAGSVSIEVIFDVDDNNIVTITARDLDTLEMHDVTVTRSPNLTDSEVYQLKQAFLKEVTV